MATLRRLKAQSQVAVLRFASTPTSCVVPAIGAFYSWASLQDITDRIVNSARPASVSVASSACLGRPEADAQHETVPAMPLKHLLRVAALRCTDSILLDEAGQDPTGDLVYYMDLFNDVISESGAVTGVTHRDERPDATLQPYHDVLRKRGTLLPLFSVDARRRDHALIMIEALIAAI